MAEKETDNDLNGFATHIEIETVTTLEGGTEIEREVHTVVPGEISIETEQSTTRH